MNGSGLRAITAHARATGPDALALCEAATSLGIATLIVPWLEPERFATRDSVRSVAVELNDAATELAAHGLQLGYHNHWFELDKDFLTGGSITCALHLSRFDLASGDNLDPPAEQPLAMYPVVLEDGRVLIEIPEGSLPVNE